MPAVIDAMRESVQNGICYLILGCLTKDAPMKPSSIGVAKPPIIPSHSASFHLKVNRAEPSRQSSLFLSLRHPVIWESDTS